MQIVIEIWEDGAGVIVITARGKEQKEDSEDVRKCSAKVCAGISLMLPMIAAEFSEKKNSKVKKKRKVEAKVVVA